jgi:phosphatidate cytidylyltransferase
MLPVPDFLTLPPLAQTAPVVPTAQWLNAPTYWLLGVVLGALIIAWVIGRALRQQPESTINPAVVAAFNRRIRAWWMMCAILVASILAGSIVTVVLFFLVSFWALREFITMTPTRRGDHRALFFSFFLFTPLQYLLIGFSGKYPALYDVYTVIIPVYASLFIPARVAFSGDPKRFLERSAKIQAGLLICVYALSHTPALLQLNIKTYNRAGEFVAWAGSKPGLLFYFILLVQLGDLFQYVWTKLLGKHVIAPQINASRTWEGLLGSMASTALAATLLWWVTPFQPWESALMGVVIAIMGFAGGMTMSAIKRDRGVRDYGTLVTGHAGVLDRIDSTCFAAPVFFHLTRYFFTGPG